MVVIPKGGSVTVFGVTITGQAGSTRHIAWELWSCVKGNDNDNCDTSQAGIRVK